jgi:Mce-associated membrane protein
VTGPRNAADAAAAASAAAEQARQAQREAERHAERARQLAADYEALVAAEQHSDTTAEQEQEQEEHQEPEPVTPATPAPAESAGAVDAATPEPASPPTRGVPVVVAAVLLVAALAFAVVALVLRLTTSGGTGGAAAVRDTVLLDARQDVVVLNTLDYRDVTGGLRRWSAASTGTLHQSLDHVPAATREHIVQARRITTAKVLDAAVVSLDARAGSATVIASIELHVAPAGGGTASVRRERLRAEMNRVDGTWKVASLEQVGVTVG